jgi:hypothetical protein
MCILSGIKFSKPGESILFKNEKVTRPRWLTPVILAIQEAKSRRTVVQSQPHQQIVQETQK